MSNHYERNILKASLCERCERYAEMVECIKEAIRIAHDEKLGLDQKINNLFSVAYKNFVGMRRSAWRVLCSEKNCLRTTNAEKIKVVDEEIAQVEDELVKICDEVLLIIEKYILSRDDVLENKESHIFFRKMIGDYCRYKAEVTKCEQLEKSIADAKQAYEKAYEMACTLESTSSLRLGCALNYSVFKYEILNQREEACKLAKTTFDAALQDIDVVTDCCYKDTTLIMQLLRDNLTLWVQKDEDVEEEAQE